MTLFTIGHSTRSLDELVSMLHAASIDLLVDVRRYPGSRRNPQFGKDELARTLPLAKIAYEHVEALGGRRKTSPDSPNTAWRNEQFRGYADHMATPEFREAFAALLARAAERRLAVMCAEAHPSHCHRRLISDAAVLEGVDVIHLLEPDRIEPHKLHPDAQRTADGRWTYPG